MPTLGEIATSVLLGDGESTVVTWNPSAKVEVSQGTFGEQYTFYCLDDNGEPCRLKGGSRLINAWKKAIAQAPKNAKQLNGMEPNSSGVRGIKPSTFHTGLELSVTARGEAGTIQRDWEVKLA